MFTIRVTQLEKFRRYRDSVSSYDTEQSVIDGITGDFKGNNYTYIGTAFHNIVETGNTELFMSEGGAVYMSEEQKQIALDYRNSMPDAFHEIRTKKIYTTPYGEVEITGCADILWGTIIRDIKTKYSQVNQQDYMDSCQWKFYLELFNTDCFIFDVFQFHSYDKEKHGLDTRKLKLTKYPNIPCFRYGKMEDDNRILLFDFLDWASHRNLLDNLKFDYDKD